jgi:hypothetical protein
LQKGKHSEGVVVWTVKFADETDILLVETCEYICPFEQRHPHNSSGNNLPGFQKEFSFDLKIGY